MANAISLKKLMEAGVHFGHQTRRWNPKMRPYIHGERNGIHIIDLVQTVKALDLACNFAMECAKKKKNIVFVGTKRQAAEIIEEEAKRCFVHYVNRRWLGGTLTNFETIRSRINRLKYLDHLRDSGDFYRKPKKELAKLNHELFRLEKNVGGFKKMKGKPDLLFVVDQCHETNAVLEARKSGIPVIAIVDTNSDPDGIDYVIPGNDDSVRSISLMTRAISDAILGTNPYDYSDDQPDDDGPDLQPSGVPRRPGPFNGETEIAISLAGYDDED